jgi:hypothetical protein
MAAVTQNRDQEKHVLVFSDQGDFKHNETSYRSFGLFVDARGYIYVSDYDNSRINIYDQTWNKKQTFGKSGDCLSCLKSPLDTAVNATNGDIVVVTYANPKIMIFSNKKTGEE